MQHLVCNALVHVIHLGVSSQCSYTIHTDKDDSYLVNLIKQDYRSTSIVYEH